MTDFDLQQQLAAQRRQQYAQQSQFNAPQGQMIGRHYVAPNALQYLASGLRSLGGMRGQQLAEEELGQIQQGKNQAIASALRGFSDMAQGRPADVLPPDQAGPVRPAQAPDMAGAYQSLLSAPTTELRQMGMQGLTQQAQANAKSAQEAQWRQILASAPDAQAAQRAGVPADYVKSYYELRNAGRDKVARTVEVSGPKGEKLVQQIDEFGASVGQPMPAYMAPVQVNRGDKIEFVAPTAGQSFTVGMSPAQRDAAARGWATVRQGEQRLAQDSGGKAPAGYRFTPDGNLEAIPGGPADIKAGQVGDKQRRSAEAAVNQAGRVISKVDEAAKLVGNLSAGLGSSMARIPGSDARNLQSALETIKANLGFAELQAMRDASPTGGALGAIAVQELVALQSTIASLDQAQSPDQLLKNLGQVRRHYDNWRKAVQQSQQEGPAQSGAPPSPAMPQGFQVIR